MNKERKMEFRKATLSDANCILEIIRQAQAYLKSQGINQWQNNYPNLETIQKDIQEQIGYVLVRMALSLAQLLCLLMEKKTMIRSTKGNGRVTKPMRLCIGLLYGRSIRAKGYLPLSWIE